MHNFAKVFITGLQTPCSQGRGVVLFCISASRFSTVGGLWVPQAEILSPALHGYHASFYSLESYRLSGSSQADHGQSPKQFLLPLALPGHLGSQGRREREENPQIRWGGERDQAVPLG